VEYALQNIVQPMGISTYTIQDTLPKEWDKSLPTKEELQEKLKVGIDI